MEFTFLGTSSGVPCKGRNVTSLAIRPVSGKSWCMVDCGEGTQHQLIRTEYSVKKLRVIFITHIHGDHCFGLPGLLASCAMSDRSQDLTIVAPKAIWDLIQTAIKTTDLHLNFAIDFIALEEVTSPLVFDGFSVEILSLSHRAPCWGFNFFETELKPVLDKQKLIADGISAGPLWGQLQLGVDGIDDNGRVVRAEDYLLTPKAARVVFVGGDNDKPEFINQLVHKPHVMIHESTYTEEVALKVGPVVQHSHAKQVAMFAQNADIKHLVLTHFSPRYTELSKSRYTIAELEQEARDHYDGQLFIARDFAKYVLSKELDLTLSGRPVKKAVKRN